MTIGCIAGLSSLVRGDEIDDLRQQMQNQYKAMQDIQNKLIELEKKQVQQDEQIKAAAASKETFKVPDTLKWAEKIKFLVTSVSVLTKPSRKKMVFSKKGRPRAWFVFALE
jgi:hypothetical protein